MPTARLLRSVRGPLQGQRASGKMAGHDSWPIFPQRPGRHGLAGSTSPPTLQGLLSSHLWVQGLLSSHLWVHPCGGAHSGCPANLHLVSFHLTCTPAICTQQAQQMWPLQPLNHPITLNMAARCGESMGSSSDTEIEQKNF